MKKIIVVFVLMVSVTALAQRGGYEDGKKKMTPEQIATLQTKKMTLALDLNDAQQKQMMALNLEKAKTRNAMIEARKAAKENEKPTADERFEMTNKRLDAQIAQKQKVKQILSDEQFAKFEKMKKHRSKKGKAKMNHRKEKMKKKN